MEKSIPPNLLNAVQDALKSIFEGGYYADKVLARLFKANRQWGKRDRQFLAETVYDMTRWWRRLSIEDQMDWIPQDYIRRYHTYAKFKEGMNEVGALTLAERESFPDWMVDLLTNEVGENQAEKILSALNLEAPVFLRPNTLKTDIQSLEASLFGEGVETVKIENPPALKLLRRQNVFATESFKKGFFEVQDLASQRVGLFLDPAPKERIADVCAGAGGKTLHLAALMHNKGSLLASDVYGKKLEELKIRARRAGVSNLKVQEVQSTKDIKKHYEKFDKVLLDAPCSGFGVVRRNPDSKWKLTEERFKALVTTQQEILQSYCRLVKVGGVMVYSTCSLFSKENQDQIKSFIDSKTGSFVLLKEESTVSQIGTEDGFYMAKLKRIAQ